MFINVRWYDGLVFTRLSLIQDPVHRAENLLLKNNKHWLSNKTERSGRIEAEIHLAQAIKIAFINIGNGKLSSYEIHTNIHTYILIIY